MVVRKVAVIGVGVLGAAVARRVHDLGYELTVCDRNEDALAPFRAIGARIADSPADCARDDVVLILVATPAQAREVILGQQGVVQHAAAHSPPMVLVMSTVSREAIREIGQEAAGHGVALLDVPVSGGVDRAISGTLTVLVAGEPSHVARAEPLLSQMGAVHDCGELGNAQTLKLINNVVCAANLVITGEAYRLALEYGLDIEKVAAVLDVSTGRNFISDPQRGAVASFRGWTSSRSVFDSTLAIVRKDVGLAEDMTAGRPGSYPSIAALSELMRGLGDETYDHWRTAAGHPTTTADPT
jgi:3-hydroxyisobutyrate dehydrogenase